MGMFGRGGGDTVVTTFAADDKMSPVVKGIRKTMDGFKKDAQTGFGLAAGISVWGTATAAIGKTVDFLGDAAKAAMADEASVVRLNASLKANVEGWNGNTDAIEANIKSKQRLGFDDETLRDSLTVLTGATHDVAEAQKIMATAMDLARYKNIDLRTASEALIKVEGGHYRSLAQLGIKMAKNATSAEALAAVQKVAAGQAEAWAETAEGAMTSMNITMDEMVESIGTRLLPHLKNAAELMDNLLTGGRSGGAIQTFIEQRRAVEESTDAVQGMLDALTVFTILTDESRVIAGQYATNLMDLGKAADQTAQDVHDLWKFFVDGGATAEQANRWVETFLINLRDLGKAASVSEDLLTSSFNSMGESIGPGSEFAVAARGTPRLMTHAVVGMRDAIKEGKAGIIEQMRDLAWQTKHPWEQKNYESWLRQKQRQALKRMQAAIAAGKPAVVEQYRQMVADIQAELSGLPGYAAGIAADAISSLAAVGTYTTQVFNETNPDAGKPKKKWKPKKNKGNGGGGAHQPPTGTKALGGAVDAGGTYLVGENGPELLHMGGGGSVTPNHRMGQPINVYVDGRRLFQITDVRNGRAIAMGG